MLKKGAHARCANCSIPDDHSAQKLLTKHKHEQLAFRQVERTQLFRKRFRGNQNTLLLARFFHISTPRDESTQEQSEDGTSIQCCKQNNFWHAVRRGSVNQKTGHLLPHRSNERKHRHQFNAGKHSKRARLISPHREDRPDHVQPKQKRKQKGQHAGRAVKRAKSND